MAVHPIKPIAGFSDRRSGEDMTGRAWYLIYSKPRLEECAREHLARQGYDVFLPMVRSQVRRNGRYIGRIEPMFPRYLFVRLAAEAEDWAPIRSTRGVSRLVRFGTWPAVVPDPLVEGLRAASDADGLVCDLTPPPVKAGDRVRVIDGVLAGYEGIVQARSGRERVELLLDVVGRQVTARLGRNDIAPA